MTFVKMQPDAYPRRLWSVCGFAGSGKSSFAARLRAPILAIDADHRFDEVLPLAGGDVYRLSETPSDAIDPERIAACLRENMPGSGVQTIVVDSLTAILAPLVTAAILDNDAGRNKNRMAAWKPKALGMRTIQDAVTGWGCDVLWIYHLQSGRDAGAVEHTTSTISLTELARLTRCLNLRLRIMVGKDGRRGVVVEWARRGRSGLTLWDDSGSWEGMPEAIEKAVYGGLTRADQDLIEKAIPSSFTGPDGALAWAVDFGAFDNLPHARNAYDALKASQAPASASEMWSLWLADVQARKAAKETPAEPEPQDF